MLTAATSPRAGQTRRYGGAHPSTVVLAETARHHPKWVMLYLSRVRRQAFDAALRDARDGMSGWTVIPAVIMGTVILLVLVGLRPRLAEYR
jgi:hypothetical protein